MELKKRRDAKYSPVDLNAAEFDRRPICDEVKKIVTEGVEILYILVIEKSLRKLTNVRFKKRAISWIVSRSVIGQLRVVRCLCQVPR